MEKAIRLNQKDDVLVALTALVAGEALITQGVCVTLLSDIPMGHKIALRDIKKGENVIKYGSPIGIAKRDIHKGERVHVDNIATGLGETLEYEYAPSYEELPHREPSAFMGFERKDGSVGVRNEIWVLPTVGCVNGVATELARRADAIKKGSVDGVFAFPHPYGCSQMGQDQENTRAILRDLMLNPNAGGVLVVGLGCENSGVNELRAGLEGIDESRLRFMVCQEHDDELEYGLNLLGELIERASKDERTSQPASKLIVGLKCGGSDGLSGVTANPVIGAFSDMLISQGGSTILTEVPEMFGAETLLMARCESEQVFSKTVRLINDFKRYFEEHGQTIYENPSPGNKQGGISTLEDKALGCTQKSGSAPVKDVLYYGQRARVKGLSLLSAPGNDLVASTALAAAGAQIVLFSTGRGTPFASPVPTVKISSNAPLAEKKRCWIDFDAGELAKGTVGLTALGESLFAYVLRVASGERVRSEINGYHDMAIFKQGVTL